MSEYLEVIIYYLVPIFVDGDFHNDWLTHMPHELRDIMSLVGELLASALTWSL